MQFIKFNRECVFRDTLTDPVFKADTVYRLEDDFAHRWIRRGVAEVVQATVNSLPDPRLPVEPVAPVAPVVVEPVAESVEQPAPVVEQRGRGRGRWK
jgi:hypothetical protein